ncbi:transmembrane and coiled-coil domain-containing protein 4-like isoform X2 [Oratosquilla oratoria]|uniref:transmembrane and coiled-coil domain-containing protein 4-like isoform X2 n=1 Tax=Oratosquilla oratoria TaxID=337810 RepID=UPI003F767686
MEGEMEKELAVEASVEEDAGEEGKSDLPLDIGDVNGNSTKAGVEPKRVAEVLSSAGSFAYCGLVAGALHHLYCDYDNDREFALKTMADLVQHLGLPEQVATVMTMTVRGEVEASSSSSYTAVVLEEPALKKSGLPIVQDLVMFAVQGGTYDARLRVLISHVTYQLRVNIDLVEMYEETVVEYLAYEHNSASEEDAREQEKKQRHKKFKRYTLIGLATLGGGAVLGLTGGLAAPFIGAGLGTMMGAGSAAALTSTAGVAVIGSLFGVAGAGLTGFKMQKRVGEVEEFAFDYLTEGSHLHITIAISGWLTEEAPDAFSKPWLTLDHSREQYCLRYESTYLLELGQAMDYLLQFAVSMAVQESLKYTILAGIISAITWPASLVTLASVIDNPWGVCCRRSAEVGRQLATVLLQRQHGRRPVTLIGFSLGARVIYYCLQELCSRKGFEGIVQDVVLLGAPVPGYEKDWKQFGKVVAGRIINGYCQSDWLLRFLYRTSSASFHIAGLGPIPWQDRRMFNFDLSEIVAGHMDYANKMGIILRLLGLRTREVPKTPECGMRKSASDFPAIVASRAQAIAKERPPLLRAATSDSVLERRRTDFAEMKSSKSVYEDFDEDSGPSGTNEDTACSGDFPTFNNDLKTSGVPVKQFEKRNSVSILERQGSLIFTSLPEEEWGATSVSTAPPRPKLGSLNRPKSFSFSETGSTQSSRDRGSLLSRMFGFRETPSVKEVRSVQEEEGAVSSLNFGGGTQATEQTGRSGQAKKDKEEDAQCPEEVSVLSQDLGDCTLENTTRDPM